MHIHLAVVHPADYLHVGVFYELAELYVACLQELGYQVSFAYNRLDERCLNLLMGYHLLPPLAAPPPNYRYIVIQLEQLGEHAGIAANPKHFANLLPVLSEALEIWDFSPQNIEYLARWNLQARLIPFGFHQRLQRISPAPEQDIDVLFFGTVSAYRKQILDRLAEASHVQTLSGCYGPERDQWISRSKIILNLHTYRTLQSIEQSRLFYLLCQPCFVISEASTDNPYADELLIYERSELVEGVLNWLKKPATERQNMAERGLQKLKDLAFQERLSAALTDIFSVIETT